MIGSTPNCPRLCPECPLVPQGVTAELADVSMLTDQEMRAYKYGEGAPAIGRAADEHLSETKRATFTVSVSTNPDVEAGDTADTLIATRGLTHEQVRQGFAQCEAPTKPGLIARALGQTARCNGLPAAP